MRAVGVQTFGGPDVLEIVELPVPEPGSGEVRLRVHAATVNPTDLLFREGQGSARALGDRHPPFIPGMDAAGVIDALGPDVGPRLTVGDPVIALIVPSGPHGGAYAEYVVVPAASVVRAPRGIDFPAASTFLMNALTARMALDALALESGQTVAVTGAAGALGSFLIQLARADGLRVIADAAAADVDLVRAQGANEVVERGDNVAAAILARVPGGVHALCDASIQEALVLPAIVDGGGLAEFRGWGGPTERGITIHRIMVSSGAMETTLLDRLRAQVEDGTLSLRATDVYPLDKAADAHRRLAAGGLRRRLVLDFSA